MSAAAALLQQAAAQVNRGDFRGAWAAFMAAVQADPGNDQAWLGLGLTGLMLGEWQAVQALADRRQVLGGDGFAFFHDLMTAALSHGLGQQMTALGAHLPADSPYLPSQLYYAGCLLLQDGDEDAAFVCFNRVKELFAARADSLPHGAHDRFNIAWRQATLVEDGDYPDRLDPAALAAVAAQLPAAETVLTWGDAAGADYVLLAACDGRYLDRFGVEFVASAQRWAAGAALHLHVAEPEPAALERLTAQVRQGGLPVVVTTEAANPHRSGAYYACLRFLVAGAVAARHGGKPVMITDIDVLFRGPAGELADLARPYAFGSFVFELGVGPASRLPAVWTWFSGADGAAMLDALRRVILSKLHVRAPHNWMLDQAALITARRWLRRAHPGAAVAEMNRVAGRYFPEFLECRGDQDDKSALINKADQGG